MTVEEIVLLASEVWAGGEYIDPVDFGLKAINQAVHDELPEESWPEKSVNINATYDTWHDLPADFVNVLEIRQGTIAYDGAYDIRSKRIRFPTTSIFTIYYRQFPISLTSIFQTPDVDPIYHEALAIWVAAKWLQKEDENETQGQYLESLFRQKISEKQNVMKWPKQDRTAVVREVY